MPVTVWKGQLTFGLVSIPIRIVRAARQERLRFTHVYRPRTRAASAESSEPEPEPEFIEPEPPRRGAKVEPISSRHKAPAATLQQAALRSTAEPARPPEQDVVAPVRRTFKAEDTGETLSPEEVLKGYEYSKGEFAVFRPDEMRRFRAETTRDMEIIEFVKLSGIDPVYFNASYYVAPDRGGEKPYSLLFEAMRRTGFAALARFAMHGREQILVLRPGARGIIMHTLFFESEVHAADEFTANTSLVTAQEMKLAELLIEQLAADFDAAKFKDDRMARMRQSIEEKIAVGKTGTAHEQTQAGSAAPVVNILDALRRSLERKPAARESAHRESAPKKRTKHGKAS
jgi:DNA end-binding protein Ku